MKKTMKLIALLLLLSMLFTCFAACTNEIETDSTEAEASESEEASVTGSADTETEETTATEPESSETETETEAVTSATETCEETSESETETVIETASETATETAEETFETETVTETGSETATEGEHEHSFVEKSDSPGSGAGTTTIYSIVCACGEVRYTNTVKNYDEPIVYISMTELSDGSYFKHEKADLTGATTTAYGPLYCNSTFEYDAANGVYYVHMTNKTNSNAYRTIYKDSAGTEVKYIVLKYRLPNISMNVGANIKDYPRYDSIGAFYINGTPYGLSMANGYTVERGEGWSVVVIECVDQNGKPITVTDLRFDPTYLVPRDPFYSTYMDVASITLCSTIEQVCDLGGHDYLWYTGRSHADPDQIIDYEMCVNCGVGGGIREHTHNVWTSVSNEANTVIYRGNCTCDLTWNEQTVKKYTDDFAYVSPSHLSNGYYFDDQVVTVLARYNSTIESEDNGNGGTRHYAHMTVWEPSIAAYRTIYNNTDGMDAKYVVISYRLPTELTALESAQPHQKTAYNTVGALYINGTSKLISISEAAGYPVVRGAWATVIVDLSTVLGTEQLRSIRFDPAYLKSTMDYYSEYVDIEYIAICSTDAQICDFVPHEYKWTYTGEQIDSEICVRCESVGSETRPHEHEYEWTVGLPNDTGVCIHCGDTNGLRPHAHTFETVIGTEGTNTTSTSKCECGEIEYAYAYPATEGFAFIPGASLVDEDGMFKFDYHYTSAGYHYLAQVGKDGTLYYAHFTQPEGAVNSDSRQHIYNDEEGIDAKYIVIKYRMNCGTNTGGVMMALGINVSNATATYVEFQKGGDSFIQDEWVTFVYAVPENTTLKSLTYGPGLLSRDNWGSGTTGVHWVDVAYVAICSTAEQICGIEGHDYTWTYSTTPDGNDTGICSRCGDTNGLRAHQHDKTEWQYGTTTDTEVCTYCGGAVHMRDHEHNYQWTHGKTEDNGVCSTCSEPTTRDPQHTWNAPITDTGTTTTTYSVTCDCTAVKFTYTYPTTEGFAFIPGASLVDEDGMFKFDYHYTNAGYHYKAEIRNAEDIYYAHFTQEDNDRTADTRRHIYNDATGIAAKYIVIKYRINVDGSLMSLGINGNNATASYVNFPTQGTTFSSENWYTFVYEVPENTTLKTLTYGPALLCYGNWTGGAEWVDIAYVAICSTNKQVCDLTGEHGTLEWEYGAVTDTQRCTRCNAVVDTRDHTHAFKKVIDTEGTNTIHSNKCVCGEIEYRYTYPTTTDAFEFIPGASLIDGDGQYKFTGTSFYYEAALGKDEDIYYAHMTQMPDAVSSEAQQFIYNNATGIAAKYIVIKYRMNCGTNTTALMALGINVDNASTNYVEFKKNGTAFIQDEWVTFVYAVPEKTTLTKLKYCPALLSRSNWKGIEWVDIAYVAICSTDKQLCELTGEHDYQWVASDPADKEVCSRCEAESGVTRPHSHIYEESTVVGTTTTTYSDRCACGGVKYAYTYPTTADAFAFIPGASLIDANGQFKHDSCGAMGFYYKADLGNDGDIYYAHMEQMPDALNSESQRVIYSDATGIAAKYIVIKYRMNCGTNTTGLMGLGINADNSSANLVEFKKDGSAFIQDEWVTFVYAVPENTTLTKLKYCPALLSRSNWPAVEWIDISYVAICSTDTQVTALGGTIPAT